jgi:hypothetical protein
MFSPLGLVVAAQVIVPVAAAGGGAVVLVQLGGLFVLGLVAVIGITTGAYAGHIMGAVSFLVHDDLTFEMGKRRKRFVVDRGDVPGTTGFGEHRAGGAKNV